MLYNNVKFFVFDFDGTLVDSNKIKENSFFRIASQVPDGERVMATIYRANGPTRRDIWRLWTEQMGLEMSYFNHFLSQYSNEVDELVVKAPPIEGALELLRHLKTISIKAFLNSATPEKNLKAIVSRRGWSALFEGIYGSPRCKDENLRNYVLPMAGSPESIAVVGDGIDDRSSAEQIGCHFFPVGGLSNYLPNENQYDLNKIRLLFPRQ